MTRTAFGAAVLALILPGATRAQQATLDAASVPPPPISAKVTDEAADVGYRPTFHLGSLFTLTPTYTFDTEQAFRVYDALQGIPSVFHTVTAGSDGHPVGYLFTDEGKAIVNNLTFHDEVAKPALERLFNDDPRGAPLTVARSKDLARGKLQP